MHQRFQLHYSGLSLLSRCGIAFENRYLRRLPETRSSALIVGSAVDRAVSADLNAKMAGALLPDDAVMDAARDAAVDEWDNKGDVRIDEQDREDGWQGTRAEAVSAAIDLAKHHHRNAAPRIEPIAVQRPWTLDVTGAAMPMQLVGTIDVQEPTAIRDTKTSAKSPKASTADESLQLTTYSLAVLRADGALPEKVALDYVVRTPKRHDLKLIVLESRRTAADLQPLINRIESAARVIQSGVFTPADPTHWGCSRKFCSYWEVCPYAVRPITVRQ